MAANQPNPIDLNTADAEQLTHIDGIDRERARLILEYRREHGPFHSWDDVRHVPGIGEALTGKARQAATLGEAAGVAGQGARAEPRTESADEGVEAGEEEGEEEDEEEEEEEEEDEDEIEALLAIAQLDVEAAAAYVAAADQVDDDDLRRMLLSFRDDHRRHVDELTKFARSRGVPAELRRPEVDGSVLVALVSTAGVLDPAAAIEAVIGNEQLTNATYETALWLVNDDDALAIVQRNREDERRHLEALTAYAAEREH